METVYVFSPRVKRKENLCRAVDALKRRENLDPLSQASGGKEHGSDGVAWELHGKNGVYSLIPSVVEKKIRYCCAGAFKGKILKVRYLTQSDGRIRIQEKELRKTGLVC